MKTIIKASNDINNFYIAGIVCNQAEKEKADSIIDTIKKMEYVIESKMSIPQSFYGIGGMKIFRDLVYENQHTMVCDHKYYKENNYYDFPQKKIFKIMKKKFLMKLLALKPGKKESIISLQLKEYQKTI